MPYVDKGLSHQLSNKFILSHVLDQKIKIFPSPLLSDLYFLINICKVKVWQSALHLCSW